MNKLVYIRTTLLHQELISVITECFHELKFLEDPLCFFERVHIPPWNCKQPVRFRIPLTPQISYVSITIRWLYQAPGSIHILQCSPARPYQFDLLIHE